MSTTTVESASWFARMKRSVGGVVFGSGLMLAMLVLLFTNEGRAVRTARGLDQGSGALVQASPQQVDPAMEGKLVYLAGDTTAPVALVDARTGVQAPALRMARKVEMFQWVESSSSKKEVAVGGTETTTTQYDYTLQWHGQPQDSSRFQQPEGHVNPAMALANESFTADGAQLGSWAIDAPVLDQLPTSQALAAPQPDLYTLQSTLGRALPVTVVDGALLVSANPQQPSVGDYRISYQLAPVQPISVIGRQTGHGIRPWQTDSGTGLMLVSAGLVPAGQMFDQAVSANSTMTWIWRALGTVLMIVAFSSILGPLSVAASVFPLLGRVLAMGTGLIATGLGLGLSVLTMGLAWVVYRPLLSLAIIAVGVAAVVGVVMLVRRRKAANGSLPSAVAQGG
jgi:hypothetical protein